MVICFNKIKYLYTCFCLIFRYSKIYLYISGDSIGGGGVSLPLIYSIQERIYNNLLMTTRKNMITVVVSKSNKIAQTKLILKTMLALILEMMSVFHRELKNIYLKCHNHRRCCGQIPFSSYVVGGSKLQTKSPMDGANSKGRGIKCISDRVSLLTKLPTDDENYGG